MVTTESSQPKVICTKRRCQTVSLSGKVQLGRIRVRQSLCRLCIKAAAIHVIVPSLSSPRFTHFSPLSSRRFRYPHVTVSLPPVTSLALHAKTNMDRSQFNS